MPASASAKVAAADDERHAPKRPRLPLGQASAVAVAVTAGHFLNDAYGAMLTPLLPQLQERFAVSTAAATLLVSAHSLTGSVLQPVLGVLGERVDRRVTAALGPLLTAVGLCFMGYVPWFGALVLLVAVAGLGSGFFHPSGAAFIAGYSPRDKRGLWASLFSAGGTAGAALGPVFAASGLEKLPYFAGFALLTAVLTYFITPPTPPVRGPRRSVKGYLEVFRGPIVTLWGMAVLRTLASMGYNTMLPFILLARGFGTGEVALALGLYAVASAVGGIVGGRISDRVGRTPVLRAAILTTIPFFIILILSTPANWWFYPLTFLMGAFVNASVPVGVVTAQEYQPKHVALASSIMMGFSWGFAGLLIFLVGALADATAPTTAAICAVLLLLPSAYLAFRLPEPEAVELGR